jgi:putative cardiolipin synthase
MQTIGLLLLTASGFALASLLALYSYGRFLERARREPSRALPADGPATNLDRLIVPLTEAHRGQSGLVLLDDNLDAFAARALSVRRAGRSLDVQTYIWKNDLTGRLLANEILAAADRGVRVRLLLDDVNLYAHDRALFALDAHSNIAVRLFNPSLNRGSRLRRSIEMALRAVRATRRMHHKAWLADGRLAVVGGRNIGNAYFDAASASNFRDLDLLMLGPAVDEASAIFDGFWNCQAALPITALFGRREARLARLRKRLAATAAGLQARPYLASVAEQETVHDTLSGKAPVHWTADVRVVSDPPEKVDNAGQERWLIRQIRPVVASARSELEIVSPYFIPGAEGTEELLGIVRRGVRVSILTNSLAATDVVAAHGAYAGFRRALIEGGVRLLELKPYKGRSAHSRLGSSHASLHTKAFTVDDREGFVGSMNFDPRSISLNAEMGVIFGHPDLVREVRDVFADEASPAKSYRLAVERGRLVWHDEAEQPATMFRREPLASLSRRLAAGIIGWLPIRSQL